jgi:hypothetical protein
MGTVDDRPVPTWEPTPPADLALQIRRRGQPALRRARSPAGRGSEFGPPAQGQTGRAVPDIAAFGDGMNLSSPIMAGITGLGTPAKSFLSLVG